MEIKSLKSIKYDILSQRKMLRGRLSYKGVNILKAFIFDMDGVIVNSEPIHYRLIKKTYGKFGIGFDHEEHKKVTGMSYLQIWQRFIDMHKIPSTKEELNEVHTVDLLDEIKNSPEVEISKGVPEFIEDLCKNGIKLAVASSANRQIIEAVLERFNLRDKFQAVVSGEELPKSKPDPAVFIKALEELKVNSHEALIVEDSTNGIKAAKGAGVKCLAFLNNGENPQNVELADIRFNCFTELNYEKVRDFLKK